MSLEKDKQTFKDILLILKKRSTCVRVQVAAIIVKDGRIISTGWNGTTSGSKHCNEIFNAFNFDATEHHNFSLKNEIHGEMNAIAMAAKNGMAVNGCDLYTTDSPCFDCAKLIKAVGIKRVFYVREYDRESTIQWLNEHNIETVKL